MVDWIHQLTQLSKVTSSQSQLTMLWAKLKGDSFLDVSSGSTQCFTPDINLSLCNYIISWAVHRVLGQTPTTKRNMYDRDMINYTSTLLMGFNIWLLGPAYNAGQKKRNSELRIFRVIYFCHFFYCPDCSPVTWRDGLPGPKQHRAIQSHANFMVQYLKGTLSQIDSLVTNPCLYQMETTFGGYVSGKVMCQVR